MNIGSKLLEIRENAKLSQGDLSTLLEKKGINAKVYTISKWENGVSNPSVEAFLAICDICNVQDIGLTFSSPKRHIRLYDIPVSAGPGNFLDASDYELIEIDNLVPIIADYAIRVSGDSMMPRFVDKQVVFIQEQEALEAGEIGVFFLNNEVFLKKLGKNQLLSLNPTYKPIDISENDTIKVLGKVVG